MFDEFIIPTLPLLIILVNYMQDNFYIIMGLPVLLLLLNDRVIITMITMPVDGTSSIFHRLKNLIFCVIMFFKLKNYEHNVEDLINNYYFIPLLGLTYFIPIYSTQETHLEIDVIYRYFCLFYFKQSFGLPESYIITSLYYASSFGIDIRDHIIYSIISYLFGIIPCVAIKVIKSII